MNTVTIVIPTTLRRFTGQSGSIEVRAETVGEALRSAAAQHPLLLAQLFTSNDQLRRFLNVFVNSSDIRFLQNEHTRLKTDDVITILPPIAGG